MEYIFRDEVINAEKAAMGEMYNLAKQNLKPGQKIINFASGHPDEETFPKEILDRVFSHILKAECDEQLLQYSSHKGYAPLIQKLQSYLNYDRKIVKEDDEILITYGSTEGISLSGFAFLNKGDRIIMEDPTYVNAIKIFQALGAEVVGAPMESDGPDLEAFESEVKRGAKLVYLVPNFNNPSGITTSLKKRKEILKLSQKYNIPIIEDDPYGKLRYRGEDVANIKELDNRGSVVYVGTMSKIIAPGMRIGYIVANKRIIDRLIILKAFHSNGVSNVMQKATAQLLDGNYMREHVKSVCDKYREKLFAIEKIMKQYLPEEVKCSRPDGGMFMWLTFPDSIDMYEICKRAAIELHVPMTPGNGFCINHVNECNSVRINFVKESLKDIEKGIIGVSSLL